MRRWRELSAASSSKERRAPRHAMRRGCDCSGSGLLDFGCGLRRKMLRLFFCEAIYLTGRRWMMRYRKHAVYESERVANTERATNCRAWGWWHCCCLKPSCVRCWASRLSSWSMFHDESRLQLLDCWSCLCWFFFILIFHLPVIATSNLL